MGCVQEKDVPLISTQWEDFESQSCRKCNFASSSLKHDRDTGIKTQNCAFSLWFCLVLLNCTIL